MRTQAPFVRSSKLHFSKSSKKGKECIGWCPGGIICLHTYNNVLYSLPITLLSFTRAFSPTDHFSAYIMLLNLLLAVLRPLPTHLLHGIIIPIINTIYIEIEYSRLFKLFRCFFHILSQDSTSWYPFQEQTSTHNYRDICDENYNRLQIPHSGGDPYWCCS